MKLDSRDDLEPTPCVQHLQHQHSLHDPPPAEQGKHQHVQPPADDADAAETASGTAAVSAESASSAGD